MGRRWVITLAGGSGTRLASMTSDRSGRVRPKQYCSLLGGRSLLGDAIARAERIVEPDRVVVVVAAEHEAFWRREPGVVREGRLVVQPQNRGTAAGVLLPLLQIAARDPAAEVVLMPSDHFVADEEALAATLRRAQQAVRSNPDRVLLVGIEPDAPEPDYGWILPGAGRGDVRTLLRFVEKPGHEAAIELQRDGGVWNSFLLAGTAAALLRLYERRLPRLLAALREARAHESYAAAVRVYEGLPDADFSRHLLEGSEARLGLCIARNCGWTDLGTPARVVACAGQLLDRPMASARPGSLAAAVFAHTA